MIHTLLVLLRQLGSCLENCLQLYTSMKLEEKAKEAIENAKNEYLRAIEKLENAKAQYEKQLEKLESSYIKGINLLKEVVLFLRARENKVTIKEHPLREKVSFINELESDILRAENKVRKSIGRSFIIIDICNFTKINRELIRLLRHIDPSINIRTPDFLFNPFDIVNGLIIKYETEAIISEIRKFKGKVAEEVFKIEVEIEKIKTETIKVTKNIEIITEITQSLNSRLQELKNKSQLTKAQIDTLVSIAKTLKGCIFKEY